MVETKKTISSGLLWYSEWRFGFKFVIIKRSMNLLSMKPMNVLLENYVQRAYIIIWSEIKFDENAY